MNNNERAKLRKNIKQLTEAKKRKAKSSKAISTRAKNSLLERNVASKSTKKCSKQNKTRLLTTAEVAQILNLSPRTLDNWRYENKGPKWVKLGRLVRYEKIEIVRFIENGRN